tara:strand:+ start:67 stop:306 length:240 start_codon:yes stop_codon:yes gene_type:complete
MSALRKYSEIFQWVVEWKLGLVMGLPLGKAILEQRPMIVVLQRNLLVWGVDIVTHTAIHMDRAVDTAIENFNAFVRLDF